MALRPPPPLLRRHRRWLIGATAGLIGAQVALLAWLWAQPMPDRLERPGQGAAAPRQAP